MLELLVNSWYFTTIIILNILSPGKDIKLYLIGVRLINWIFYRATGLWTKYFEHFFISRSISQNNILNMGKENNIFSLALVYLFYFVSLTKYLKRSTFIIFV